MTQKPPPNPEELILAMLRDVLARQAEAMGLQSETNGKPESKAPPPPQPATLVEPPMTHEAIIERVRSQAAYDPIHRAERPPGPAAPPPSTPPLPQPLPAPSAPQPVAASPSGAKSPAPQVAEGEEPLSTQDAAELAEFEALAAEPLAPGGFMRAVRWSIVAILIVIVLASLPFFDGQSLFRVQSEAQNLVLRDGLLLKGSGDGVYVIEGSARRLITSVDAFEHYGFRWSAITEVDDAALDQIPEGRPISVLLTCEGIQDIYLLTGFEKRIVRDLEALQAEGYTLERDLRLIPCDRLRRISDGLPFP